MTKFTDRLWTELVHEHGTTLAHSDRPAPGRARRPRPRILAGGTLALAGIGVALTLALTGTSAQPALAALTVTHQPDGSVLVEVNVSQSTQPWVLSADRKLAAMGLDEVVGIVSMAPGPAPVSGPVDCKALGGVNTPPGPPVKVLLGTDGTQVIPAGITGAGTVHLGGCIYFKTPTTNNTGNTGNPGPATLPR
jgi:hypothetical protein